tara:strand:+ start:125 stop:559 length:435 start_codon:yes stop_codon:yes gene_type:complete
MAKLVTGGYPEFQEGLRQNGQRTFDMPPETRIRNNGKTLETLKTEQSEYKSHLIVISQACELAHTNKLFTMKESQSVINALDYLDKNGEKPNALLGVKELKEKKKEINKSIKILIQACEKSYDKGIFSMSQSKEVMDAIDYLNK